MKTFKVVNGDISDGYHTFDELYEHRCLLFINLCLMDKDNCFLKKDHYKGWDCIYWLSPSGQISYHVPVSMRPLYEKTFLATPRDYDGHESKDVIFRLRNNALLRKADDE